MIAPDIARESRIDRLYELLLGAAPDGEERSDLGRFIRETEGRLIAEGNPDAEARAWSMACHALLASTRFQILE